jgi:hypothetical protein
VGVRQGRGEPGVADPESATKNARTSRFAIGGSSEARGLKVGAFLSTIERLRLTCIDFVNDVGSLRERVSRGDNATR